MVKAGAFDGVGTMHRAQYLHKEVDAEGAPTYLDTLFRWAVRRQENVSAAQFSIFDMNESLADEEHPQVPDVAPLNSIEQCRYEQEVVSTYLGGHPLDEYRYEMQAAVNTSVAQLHNLEELAGKDLRFAGLVSGCKEMRSKKGEPFGSMIIDDYTGSYELRLFGDDYSDFSGHFKDNTFVFVKGYVYSRKYNDKNGVERTYTSLRINTMKNLGGVLDNYATKLCFKVNLADLTEDLCARIEELAAKHRGKVPIQAMLVDPARQLTLTFGSNKLKVTLHDFLAEFEKLPGVYDIKPMLLV